MKRVVRVRLRSIGFVVSKKTAIVVFCLPFVVAFLFFAGTSLLRVRGITCEISGGQNCDEVLLAESQKIVGTPFYALQFSAMEQRMLQAMPQLKSIHFSLHPPAQVKVIGELHQSAFLIKMASGSATYVVSENGVLTREAEDDDLVSLGLPAEIQNGSLPMLGESLEVNLQRALSQTMKHLQSSSLAVTKVVVFHARQIELVLANGQYGIIDGMDAEGQLNALQQLLNTATIKEQSVQRIDVRFARPVLR